jgi:uncharacterized protein
VEKIADLRPGMILEGVVTNVAAFGAFVDIGVHQDGLVHVSALSDTFVKDPREVVKSGDVVRVRVVEVDEARKRISLTMRLEDSPRREAGDRGRGGQPRSGDQPRKGGQPSQGREPRQSGGQRSGGRGSSDGGFPGGAMADALRRAGLAKD